MTHTRTAVRPQTLQKLNYPHFSAASWPTVRGSHTLSRNDDQAVGCTRLPPTPPHRPPLHTHTHIPPPHSPSHICQTIKGFLWSYFSPPIRIVWHMLSPYISLTPPWTRHIHLTRRRDGGRRRPGPLGTRRGRQRWRNTCPFTQPRQIHFSGIDGAVQPESR